MSFYLPWWIIVPLGLIIGFFYRGKRYTAFACGAIAQLLLWFGLTMYFNVQNEGLLLEKMATLFGDFSPTVLMLFIGLVGAITGGLSLLTGKTIQFTFQGKKTADS